jgi:DNA processing protein
LASGSLISARIAADLGRDVFAIPGSIHAPLSKGCHHLIKQGAKLVETAQDVLEEMNVDLAPAPDSPPGDAQLDAKLRIVLAAMGHDPCSVDALHALTRLPVDEILAALMQLEIEGQVSAVAGGAYQRIF